MSDEINRKHRRHFWRCCDGHYHVPASRDRYCALITQQDRASCRSAGPRCGRYRLHPELPLAAPENCCAGPKCVWPANA